MATTIKRYRKEESESDIEDEEDDYVPYVSVKERKKQVLMKHKKIVTKEEEKNVENKEEKKDIVMTDHQMRTKMSLLDQHHELKEQAKDVQETELEKQLKEEQKILESIAERKALM